jgi:hypothetical protein
MTLLLDLLKFEKELPILGPGRFENFVNSPRQALAEHNVYDRPRLIFSPLFDLHLSSARTLTAHCSTLPTYRPATVTSITRPVNISVTNSLPVFGSSAMLVGVIKQLAITAGAPAGEVNNCNLPGACAN